MHVLSIAKRAHRHIREHAEAAYPHECCGALLGKALSGDWQVVATIRANNAHISTAHNRYAIAPAELVAIQREATHQGLDIAGFYHSHPDHPPHWSQTDLDEAHWIGCCYVITAVAQGKAAETQAFFLAGRVKEDKRFESMQIKIVASNEIARPASVPRAQ